MTAVFAVFGLAACGDDDDAANDGTTAPVEAAPVETAPPAPETEAPPAAPAGKKPKVNIPSGAAPSKLVTTDIKKGKGAQAKKGDAVSVHYVGVLFKGGKQFDASWDRGEPFSFQLGAGMVIPGWDKGVAGMREGGRRRLVIPSDLAYGPQGQPPDIPGGATLVFVVDLLEVQ